VWTPDIEPLARFAGRSPRWGDPSKYLLEFRREGAQLVLTSDRSMADIARELGVHHKALGNWVSDERRRRARAAEPAAVSEAERDELRRLHKEVAELRTEREILRKAAAHFAKETTRVSRFRFVSEHRAEFGVKRLCRVLEVSRSGFYAWSGRPPSVRTVRDAELAVLIVEAHHRSRLTYRARRIHAELRRLDQRCSRRGRGLLGNPQTRARLDPPTHYLVHPDRATQRPVRRHRSLLQLRTHPTPPRPPQPRHLREDHRSRLKPRVHRTGARPAGFVDHGAAAPLSRPVDCGTSFLP
jgi:transposase